MDYFMEPIVIDDDYHLDSLEEYPSYIPLREAVLQVLKKAILNGSLKPGQLLSENKIAAKLSVSRTPIREALRILEIENLVVTLPGRKVIVSIPTVQDIKDIYEIRLILEVEALRTITPDRAELIRKLESCIEMHESHLEDYNTKAMGQNNAEFHLTIISALENKKIKHFIDSLNDTISRFRLYSVQDKEYMGKVINEHKKIVLSLKNGEIETAVNVLRQHLITAKNILIEMYSKKDDRNKEK